jgi:pimeloyl-ACP methyl ester carboxylesterase
VLADADEIERNITLAEFSSSGERFDLVCFVRGTSAPNILISQGSGGHAYVFAELGYEMYRRGYNVFIMPRHGGHTVAELLGRHRDALGYISRAFNQRIGAYGEGLGGYVVFYLALEQGPMKSVVCQNAPAIMTEAEYHEALVRDSGPWLGAARRRRIIIPLAKLLVRILPRMKNPISSYLDWKAIKDKREGARDVERRLVEDGYLNDPDFDRWYPLSAVMSLISTPPPNPLAALRTPTMFLVGLDGPTPEYIKELFRRLPPVKKRLIEVNGGVFWMLSHPKEAADAVCCWFDGTV